MKTKKQDCRNNSQRLSYEFKIFVIHQILNGQISISFASKIYIVSRRTSPIQQTRVQIKKNGLMKYFVYICSDYVRMESGLLGSNRTSVKTIYRTEKWVGGTKEITSNFESLLYLEKEKTRNQKIWNGL